MPVAMPHHVEMVDVAGARPLGRQRERQVLEVRLIAGGQRAAMVVHRVEPAQQHAAHRGLDVVEAQIEADLGMHVLVEPAVIAQPPAARRDVVVIGHEQSAVAHHRQVLGGVEREGAGPAEAADLPALPGSAVGLRAILEEPEAALGAKLLDAGQIGRLAVEMNGHEAHSPGADLARGVVEIHGVRVVGVDEDGHGARKANGLDRGEGGVRRDQHLVVGFDAKGLERHPERGRGARREHRVLGAVVARELGLEGLALRAENVLARVDRGEHGGLDLIVNGRAGQLDRHQRVPPEG
jgi:hypothetical protein